MSIQQFLNKLKSTPTEITFLETMAVIEDGYNFTPTTFLNGELTNKAEENSGSCKIFAFGNHQKLSKEHTLYCFGEHYKNVLQDPQGTSHQNIRSFIKNGFNGLSFRGEALTLKK